MLIFRAIVLSVLLHLAILAGLESVPDSWAWKDLPPQTAEFVIIDKKPAPESPRQRIVRDAEAPENQRDDLDEDPRFLSARRQRVIQETKARQTGLTRNGVALPENSWMRAMRQPTSSGRQPENRTPSEDGYEPIPIPRPAEETNIAFENAPSTVGEVMPEDVAFGDFTALNTDRFKYYSFYSRVEELVRFRWERGLQRAAEGFPSDYLLNTIGRRNWVTRVEFWLTREGRFHSARVHKESGIRPFDLAAINAFKDAAVFPNPPADMIESDGFIRLQYSFNVQWSPSALAGARGN